MVKHLGSKKTKYRTERNAIRTKPVFAEFYLFFLLLFCFRPGYILLFAHFIDRTFVAFYLGNELFTSTLYYPSISKRDACALNHSVLGTHYSVVLSTQWVLIPTPKCEPNRTTEPTEQQIRNESRRQEKVVSPPLSLFFSTALAAESGIRGERSLHSPTSLETWNDTKKGGSRFKTLIIESIRCTKTEKGKNKKIHKLELGRGDRNLVVVLSERQTGLLLITSSHHHHISIIIVNCKPCLATVFGQTVGPLTFLFGFREASFNNFKT